MVSAAQIDIYTAHNGDIDLYQRRGSPQMAILGDSWKTIEDLRRGYFWSRWVVPLQRSLVQWKLTCLPGLRMRVLVASFAQWLRPKFRHNRNPKWNAREPPFVRGRNWSNPVTRRDSCRDGQHAANSGRSGTEIEVKLADVRGVPYDRRI
jgi:hypothetical protein